MLPNSSEKKFSNVYAKRSIILCVSGNKLKVISIIKTRKRKLDANKVTKIMIQKLLIFSKTIIYYKIYLKDFCFVLSTQRSSIA